MANTTSIKFPNMFNIVRNEVSLLEDNQAVVNRTKLLLLTEPSELYNEPDFGVGLKRHLWKYNTLNEQAIIKDRTIQQLELHEPYVDAQKTATHNGLLFTGDSEDVSVAYNKLEMTMVLQTTFGGEAELVVEGNDNEVTFKKQSNF